MDLYTILRKSSCAVHIPGRTKDDVIVALAKLAVKSEVAAHLDPAAIEEALRKRESEGSTGFGNEIAIPHARIEGLSEFMVFIATSKRGVDFDAMDKKRVSLFFVILGPPEAVTDHLKILASVSRTLGHTNVKAELLAARSPDTLYESFLRNAGESPQKRSANRVMKLMIVNLYDDDLMYSVLELLIQEGIDGATILDSAGMGAYISNVPLFADFIGFMRENKHTSKTVLALIPEEEVDRLMNGIEEITGDLDRTQGAVIIVLDVARVRGSMDMV